MISDQQSYDYIIVGAGSAGCVLANRLSVDPAVRVLLIEAGARDWYPWIHIPVGYFKTLNNPAWDWRYNTAAEAGLNGRSLAWPRGKCLGGSSSINGLLYIRGNRRDYDDWRQAGNVGWAYDDVLPYFRLSERHEHGADAHHGADGPLAVTDTTFRTELSDRFIRAAAELGLPVRNDFNGAEQEGAGYFQLTVQNGRRCSSAVAFLKPVRDRSNLHVLTKAGARRVLFDGKKATGVAVRRNGREEEYGARREVILAAGAIGSPQLLALSGIGAGQELQDLGITPLHDLPGVGQNLQDHLQIRMVYRINRPISLNDYLSNPVNKVVTGLNYIFRRRGPLTLAASQVCVFCRSTEAEEIPDIQFHMQPLSADSPGEGLHPFSAFTSSTCQLRPESRGRLRLTSPDADVHPVIHANYLSAQKDQEIAVAGMRWSRKIAATETMRAIIAEERAPGAKAESDAELLDAGRDLAQSIYHPAGTCKMGPEGDKGAVVDPKLRVRGVDGLRVVDASIMPTLVSGNTNAPTIMIAEKAADMIIAGD